MTYSDMIELLMSSTEAMFAEGQPLMNRVLPADATAEVWVHYPPGDVVNGEAGSRFFYHSHPPGERIEDEHGHFHLFLARSAMNGEAKPLIAPQPAQEGDETPRAEVVHVAALSISTDGLPMQWFTTNRWVTDEWLYPAEAVIAELARFDLRGPVGDPLVNSWLTAMVGLARADIARLLRERDATLHRLDMGGENRAVEVTSAARISLERILEAA